MTTAAPRPDHALTEQELDERTLDAWTAYRESLRELTGSDYDEAEHTSWERLQGELRELDEQRAELAGHPAAGGAG
jgi:hypothetical protein